MSSSDNKILDSYLELQVLSLFVAEEIIKQTHAQWRLHSVVLDQRGAFEEVAV